MLEDGIHAALVGRQVVEPFAVHPDARNRPAGAAAWFYPIRFLPTRLEIRPRRSPAIRRATPAPGRIAWQRRESKAATLLGGLHLVPDLVVLVAAGHVFPEVDALLIVIQVVEMQVLLLFGGEQL